MGFLGALVKRIDWRHAEFYIVWYPFEFGAKRDARK